MTAPRRAADGFSPGRSRKRAIRPRDVIHRILRIWEYILAGAGPGRRIAACSITARRATWTASRGIPRESKFGVTRAHKNGWETTFPISKLIPGQKINWARSSRIQKAGADSLR